VGSRPRLAAENTLAVAENYHNALERRLDLVADRWTEGLLAPAIRFGKLVGRHLRSPESSSFRVARHPAVASKLVNARRLHRDNLLDRRFK
jgi:hypothetical protein